jgi:hypothetical protein
MARRAQAVVDSGQMKRNNRKINAAVRQSSKRPDLWGTALICALALSVLGSAGASAQSPEDFCGHGVPQGFDRAPQRLRSGRYVNAAYGYSLDIPAGRGAVVSAMGPERGFLLALSEMPRAYLRVDAGYDAFYDITPAGIHRRDLNTIRLHDAVIADEAAEVSLSHQAGGRFLTRLQCRSGGDVLVHEAVIVVRNREIYRLDLQSTPDRLAQDRQQLEAMIRSWRWEAIR